jgi:hypothetical protein
MWSDKFNSPFVWLTILGTISYIGGINAYFIGKIALKFPKFRAWLENRNAEFFCQNPKMGRYNHNHRRIVSAAFCNNDVSGGNGKISAQTNSALRTYALYKILSLRSFDFFWYGQTLITYLVAVSI